MPPKKKGDAEERVLLMGRIGTNLKVIRCMFSHNILGYGSFWWGNF